MIFSKIIKTFIQGTLATQQGMSIGLLGVRPSGHPPMLSSNWNCYYLIIICYYVFVMVNKLSLSVRKLEIREIRHRLAGRETANCLRGWLARLSPVQND